MQMKASIDKQDEHARHQYKCEEGSQLLCSIFLSLLRPDNNLFPIFVFDFSSSLTAFGNISSLND